MSLETHRRIIDLAPHKDQPAQEFRPHLDPGMAQELPPLEKREQLQNDLQEFCRTAWQWCRERVGVKQQYVNLYPHVLPSVFPELIYFASLEAKKVLKITSTKVEVTVLNKRQSKKYDEVIGFSSSPAVRSQVVVTVEAGAGNFTIVRNLTCYLSGKVAATEQMYCTYHMELDPGSQHILKVLGDQLQAARKEEPEVRTIFTDLTDKVKISNQGLEHVKLENWISFKVFLHQAPKDIFNALSQQLGTQLGSHYKTRQTMDTRATEYFKTVIPEGDNSNLLTLMKQYLREKIIGCTWTIKAVDFYVTRAVTETVVAGKTITTPKYAFSIQANMYSNSKYVGTFQRDFEVDVAYDHENQTFSVETTFVQTQRDLNAEMAELKKDWNERAYIGRRIEESNLMRYPFRIEAPGLRRGSR